MGARVVHFEVPFDDGERSLAFYRDVFDWDINAMPEMQYNIVSTGPTGDMGPTEPGYIGGGMLQRQAPVQSPVIVLAVDDIDTSLSRRSQRRHDRPGQGARRRHGLHRLFRDCEGNLMGLWQNAG